MCWPTSFDMHLCERIIDLENNLSALGRMSIMAKEECWRVRRILNSSQRCSLTLSAFPPKAETTSANILFQSNQLENNESAPQRHTRDCLRAKPWPVMWLGLHWLLSTAWQLSERADLNLSEQTNWNFMFKSPSIVFLTKVIVVLSFSGSSDVFNCIVCCCCCCCLQVDSCTSTLSAWTVWKASTKLSASSANPAGMGAGISWAPCTPTIYWPRLPVAR